MKKQKTPLTYERLREAFFYNPRTGVFVWASTRRGQRPKIGDIAGSVGKKSGYCIIGIDGFTHGAHRLAWFYMTGDWPKHEVDHKNRKRSVPCTCKAFRPREPEAA